MLVSTLFGHRFHHLLCWFGIVALVVVYERLRLPVRLVSRVRTTLSQHTPVILGRHDRRISLYVENPVTKLGEKSPLEWFGEVVTQYFSSWAVFQFDPTTIGSICYKIVSNIDMTSALTARCSSVLLQKDSTFIVLVDETIVDVVTLCS